MLLFLSVLFLCCAVVPYAAFYSLLIFVAAAGRHVSNVVENEYIIVSLPLSCDMYNSTLCSWNSLMVSKMFSWIAVTELLGTGQVTDSCWPVEILEPGPDHYIYCPHWKRHAQRHFKVIKRFLIVKMFNLEEHRWVFKGWLTAGVRKEGVRNLYLERCKFSLISNMSILYRIKYWKCRSS